MSDEQRRVQEGIPTMEPLLKVRMGAWQTGTGPDPGTRSTNGTEEGIEEDT